MAESTEPRTRVEKLLIELLYQTLMNAESSDKYVENRLKKAGLTESEINELNDND
jgi:hypothetical protein